MEKYLPLITVSIAVSNIIGPMPHVGELFSLYLLGLLIFFLLKDNKLSIDKSTFFIIVAAVLSIFVNNPPEFFHSWERLGQFVIIAGVISPLFQNTKLPFLREKMFMWLLRISVLITILSFIGFFFGINYMRTRAEFGHVGTFGGITVHSMILGPIAAISLLFSFSLGMKKIDLPLVKRSVYWIVAGASFLTILLTASRSSLIASLIGVLFLIYKLNQRHLNLFFKYIIAIFVLLIVSFPLWDSYAFSIMEKQKSNTLAGSTTSSRDRLWSAREKEFKSSPLFGVGYAAVSEDFGNAFNKATGQIEPGTSWGAVLSMLGILGFIPFVWLLGSNFYFLYKDSQNTYVSALLGGVLIFFAIHMIAEGYVFGAGSFLFFMLWLTIGTVVAYRRTDLLVD